MELRSIVESNCFEHSWMLTYSVYNDIRNLFRCSSGYLLNNYQVAFSLYKRYDAMMAITTNNRIAFPVANDFPGFNLGWAFLN